MKHLFDADDATIFIPIGRQGLVRLDEVPDANGCFFCKETRLDAGGLVSRAVHLSRPLSVVNPLEAADYSPMIRMAPTDFRYIGTNLYINQKEK